MHAFNRQLYVILLAVMFIGRAEVDSCIQQSFLTLSTFGLEFAAADEQALLLRDTTATSITACAQKCHEATLCRIFNLDLQINRCRLYEGDVSTTGSIIISSSPRAMYGSIRLDAKDFADLGQSCSACADSRSLRCVSGACRCQVRTYFDGSVCRSEKLRGAACASGDECRRDFNLTCVGNTICEYNGTIIYSNTSRSASSSTTTSTTSTSTTTTRIPCNSSCTNQTWTSSANLQAQWLFDGNYLDTTNNYNATPANTMSFVSNGYIRSALAFAVNATPMLTAQHIPLSSTSFTIDAWIYPTSFWNFNHHILLGLCSAAALRQCLHLTIRRNISQYSLHLGLFSNDCTGTTPVLANTWTHATFVADPSNSTQTIYLNGVLDKTCPMGSALNVSGANFTIGYIPLLAAVNSNFTYFQGYMDQVTVSTRVKSSCEILELATLVAHFTFDDASLVVDSGPNSFNATTQLTTAVSSGRFSQAISFNGSSSSYFQAGGFAALGTSNKPFSFSLWIRPTVLQGVLLHVSSMQGGNGWCVPFLTFTANSSLAALLHNGTDTVAVVDSTSSVATSVWSHVVQTWSGTNGLRLYVNNVLVASRLSSATNYAASGASNYVTVASTRNRIPQCDAVYSTNALYRGDVDDLRVYRRELSASDVCALYTA